MKRNKKIYNIAFMGLVGMAMASCSNDLPDFNQGGSTPNGPIGLIKSPDMVAWSGNQTLGSTMRTFNYDGSMIQTRGANVNGNLWYQNWDCPINVWEPTHDSSEYVLTQDDLNEIKRLLSPGEETHNEIILPWENYWVQQVYKGEDSYPGMNKQDPPAQVGNEILGSDHMNKLVAWNGTYIREWDEYKWNPETNQNDIIHHSEEVINYEHVNNFNSGNNTTVYTEDGNGTHPNQKYYGTTLMTGMPTTGFGPEEQFGFHETWGTNHDYNNYLIVKYKGYYYVGFDYEAHKYDQTSNNVNEAYNIERDWKFTDWIVRISPAYHKGETPSNPGNGGNGGNGGNEGGSDGDEGDDGDNGGNGNNPTDPDRKHYNEVEVNFSINDTHDAYTIEDLVSKLSIHVRYPKDVTVTIPVPTSLLVKADDLAIVLSHKYEMESYGKTHSAIYNVNENQVKLQVTYNQAETDANTTYILVRTEGINEDVMDYLFNTYGDGINFEVYLYYHWNEEDENGNWIHKPGNAQIEWLQEKYLNDAVITFASDLLPHYYINAFGVEYDEDGNKIDDQRKRNDCTVKIVDAQKDYYNSPDNPSHHLNGTKWNYIYVRKGIGADGVHSHQ